MTIGAMTTLDCGCKATEIIKSDGTGYIEFYQCPMHKAAPQLRATLEAVEWVGDVGKYCPWCEHGWCEPHDSDCQRQQALAAAKGGE